ncbi:DMP19 family protein [Desulforegula conservatrix]|uniref:DMP19 family protein n=1 Tax=Desulforegula conservatrix TaxID=153026 RepID=UPI000483ACB8|nr:DUF4375 domain-containing protein [Desulforegula conservatrix]
MNTDKEEILEKVSDYCFEQLDEAKNDPSCLKIPVQTVIAIYSAQGIIDNGSFQYFFESDFPQTPPYSFFSDAYRRIGADNVARNIDQAVELFGFPEPHLNIDKRKEFLEQRMHEDCLFHKLGDEACGDESVWRKLADYVIENMEEFDIS